MRALRAFGHGRVSVVEIDDPVPPPGEVLVAVETVGVCSTDRKYAQRELSGPRTLGHEVTGRLPDGTVVGIHPEIGCGRCATCLAGWHNRCPQRQALGLERDGGLAELVTVPNTNVIELGDLDLVSAAMLEPLACLVHALETAELAPGSPAAVVGAGTMGILCTWLLQSRGSRVVVCQRSEARRRLALDLGADAAVAPDGDPVAALGERPSAVFVTAPGSAPLAWALEQAATGGLVHAFTGTPGGATIDANVVHYRHLRLIGSTGSRRADHVTARDLVAAGEIKIDHLPHEVVGLEDAPARILGRPEAPALKTVVAVGAAGSRTTLGGPGEGRTRP